MPLPRSVRDDAIERVVAFCRNRIPVDLADGVRLEYGIRGNSITIVERRPPWDVEAGSEWSSARIAQIRYDERRRRWSLLAPDSSGRWHPYALPLATDVETLLAEVDRDPTGIFWG